MTSSGKGDRAIQFVEVTEREPWFVEGLRYTGEQIKGSCLVPKRAMDVMQCEVGLDLFPDLTFCSCLVPKRAMAVMQCEVGFYPDPTFYVDAGPDPDPTIS